MDDAKVLSDGIDVKRVAFSLCLPRERPGLLVRRCLNCDLMRNGAEDEPTLV